MLNNKQVKLFFFDPGLITSMALIQIILLTRRYFVNQFEFDFMKIRSGLWENIGLQVMGSIFQYCAMEIITA